MSVKWPLQKGWGVLQPFFFFGMGVCHWVQLIIWLQEFWLQCGGCVFNAEGPCPSVVISWSMCRRMKPPNTATLAHHPDFNVWVCSVWSVYLPMNLKGIGFCKDYQIKSDIFVGDYLPVIVCVHWVCEN